VFCFSQKFLFFLGWEGPKFTRSWAGGPKGNELKLINLELVIMGFYTILNTGQLAGDSLLSPGAPVNNCRWASVQLSLIPGPLVVYTNI